MRATSLWPRGRTLLLASLVGAMPCFAWAACEPSTTLDTPELSPEQLQLRAARYRTACEQVGGSLLDADDVRIAKLVRMKEWRSASTPDFYPHHLKLRGVQGLVVVTEIIGSDGRPQSVTVLVSSGNTELDAAAVRQMRSMRYEKWPDFNGREFQAFRTVSISFKLSADRTGLPPKAPR